jgi:hypothetical protein
MRLYTAPIISRKKKIGHKGELYWEERWDIIGKFVPPLPLPPILRGEKAVLQFKSLSLFTRTYRT